jgi:hypothetical protein
MCCFLQTSLQFLQKAVLQASTPKGVLKQLKQNAELLKRF